MGALVELVFAVVREQNVVSRPETSGHSVADATRAGDYEDGERGRVEPRTGPLGGC